MKSIIITLFFFFLCELSFPQVVSTINTGASDDAIAVDSNGNIYTSHIDGNTVLKYNPSTGDITTFISGLTSPNGLAFDSNDNLFVCDLFGDTIYKYDITGNLLNSYPNSGGPSGIIKSYDNDSMIFTEYFGNTINLLSPDGTITEMIPSNGILNGPVGLAYDDNSTLYVSNYNNRAIYRITPATNNLIFVAQLQPSLPIALGFISFGQGRLWATIWGQSEIYSINPYGFNDFELIYGNGTGNMDGDISVATFNNPNGIFFNLNTNEIYITDYGSKNLRIISDANLLSVHEFINTPTIDIFPNPFLNELNINLGFLESESYQIKIYSALGKLMFNKIGKATTENKLVEKIDTSMFSSGLYFIEIRAENKTHIFKVIK